MAISENEKIQRFCEAVSGADRDDAWEQFMLGMFYYYGVGISSEKILAHKWFKISASNIGYDSVRGSELSKSVGDILAKDMSEKDMTRAQELADDWIKRNRKTT